MERFNSLFSLFMNEMSVVSSVFSVFMNEMSVLRKIVIITS